MSILGSDGHAVKNLKPGPVIVTATRKVPTYTYVRGVRVQNGYRMVGGDKIQTYRNTGTKTYGSKSSSSSGGSSATRNWQVKLRNLGLYHGPIDGIWGPMTTAAMKAYHQRGSSGGSKRSSGGGGSGGGSGGGGRIGGGGGGSGGGGKRRSGGSGGGLQAINAGKYAQAQTNLQFASLLDELNRQRDNLQGQQLQNQADINSWFNQVANVAQTSAQANQLAAEHAQSQQKNDFQGILQALGGSASGQAGQSLGNFQQALAAGLAGISQAQGNFDNTQQTDVAQAKATAQTQQKNLAAQQMADINAKITQANQDRGNALVKNRYDAQQLRLQQLAAIQNMKITGKQFGMDMAIKQAQLTNMNYANAALGRQLAQQLKSKNGSGFTSLQPGDKAKLSQGVNATMYGANMSTGKNPRTAWVEAARVLRSLGYNVGKSKPARQWLSSVWMNYVSAYNRNHPNSKYKAAANGTPWPDSEW